MLTVLNSNLNPVAARDPMLGSKLNPTAAEISRSRDTVADTTSIDWRHMLINIKSSGDSLLAADSGWGGCTVPARPRRKANTATDMPA